MRQTQVAITKHKKLLPNTSTYYQTQESITQKFTKVRYESILHETQVRIDIT